MAHVVIIDDDPILQILLEEHCTILGHSAKMASSIKDAKSILSQQLPDLIFLDVRLPDGNGLDFLPELQALKTKPEIIIITGQGDDNGAELAIKTGVWDYLEKPLSFEDIVLHIKRSLEYHDKKLLQSYSSSLKRDSIIGDSTALNSCLNQLAHCAGTDTGVLITGETGTGKELFARAVHENSPRAGKPFIIVDCTNLPGDLAESVLFGHTKGSFTGASGNQRGLVELAHEGTLFLDEAGELPMEIQKSFLRVLQEKSYRPVGKEKELKSNFRLIAATNRDLQQMVEQGSFRADLYFRLNSLHIHLPPLRKRHGDITKLAMHFLFDICRSHGLSIKGILPETLEALECYSWPGNVRELRNVMEKAILTDPNTAQLFPILLPPEIRLSLIRSKKPTATGDLDLDPQQQAPESIPLPFADVPFKIYRNQMLAEIERHYLSQVLSTCNGDITAACEKAQLSRSRLYELLKRYSLL